MNPSNEDVAGTLPSNTQGGQRTTDIAGAYVVGAYRKSARVNADPTSAETWVEDGKANTLNRFDVGDVRTTHAVDYDGVPSPPQPTVRRLTPLECERLMGFPDGYTDVPWNGKDHAPDTRRYQACGNGVVSPVAYWIAARLREVLS